MRKRGWLIVGVVVLAVGLLSGCSAPPEEAVVGVWGGIEDGSALSMNADGSWVHETVGGVDSGTYTHLGDAVFSLASDTFSDQYMEVTFELDGEEGTIVITGDVFDSSVELAYQKSDEKVRPAPSTERARLSLVVEGDSGQPVGSDDYLRALLVRSWAYGFGVEDFEGGDSATFTLASNVRDADTNAMVTASTQPQAVVAVGGLTSQPEEGDALPADLVTEGMLLSGGVSRAVVEADPTGGFAVTLVLTEGSASDFSSLTSQNVGAPMAFVVDGRVIVAPSVNEPITDGSLTISAGMENDEAAALAIALKSGSLPLGLTVVDSRVVAP